MGKSVVKRQELKLYKSKTYRDKLYNIFTDVILHHINKIICKDLIAHAVLLCFL